MISWLFFFDLFFSNAGFKQFFNFQADATLAGYRKHIESKNADKPLSFAEMELEEIKRKEVSQFLVFTFDLGVGCNKMILRNLLTVKVLSCSSSY